MSSRRLHSLPRSIRPSALGGSWFDAATSGARPAERAAHPKPVTVQSDLLLRVLSVDRPATLNALDLRTLRQISARLASWQRNYMVLAGVIRGNGTAFCGGSDIARIYRDAEAGVALRTELCRVANTVHRYPKPLVSLIDGPVIGSGYALAHARHRIATERAAFLVYEPSFGLALEGGLSHILSRLSSSSTGSTGSSGSSSGSSSSRSSGGSSGSGASSSSGSNRRRAKAAAGAEGCTACGAALGLTGMTLSGIDLVHVGLASAYLPTGADHVLVKRMAEALAVNRDQESEEAYARAVDMAVFGCCHAFSVTAGFPPAAADGLMRRGMAGFGRSKAEPLPELLDEIEKTFGGISSVEEAVDRLEGSAAEWAPQALKRLRRSSPLALKVTFEQLRRGAGLTFEDCLAQEFAAADYLSRREEHTTAVAALLQDRGAVVQWKQALEDIFDDEVEEALAFRPELKLDLND